MIVNFNDFKSRPDAVVQDVLQFVGADPGLYEYKPLPPAMVSRSRYHADTYSTLQILIQPSVKVTHTSLAARKGPRGQLQLVHLTIWSRLLN
jgi:hypothetical protein